MAQPSGAVYPRNCRNSQDIPSAPLQSNPQARLIECTDAAAMPEALCWTTDGFMNRMASSHGHGDLWRWERPTPDRVVYRMLRAP